MRAISALAALLFAGAAVAQAPQQKLDSTLNDLAQNKKNEAQLKQKLAETERDMQRMRERAAGIGERLQVSERRVTKQEEELAKVNAKFADKKNEFEQRKKEYAKTVMSLMRLRNLPPTAIFSKSEDTQSLLRTASILEKTNQAVAEKAARLRSDISELKALQADSRQKDAETKAEQLKLREEQNTLARELNARQKLQGKLNADHTRTQAKIAELSQQSQNLQELIRKLDENEKAQSRPKAPSSTRAFDGKKGSARAPVAGSILHHFGEPQNANATYHGMVFKARPGATVVAPYDGEIVFTGPFRDYGNMVLIKHKNGYISLIAGLGSVNASVNQSAIRGEPIGTMPQTGSGEAYVELRDSNAKPIDPSDWFANVVSR